MKKHGIARPKPTTKSHLKKNSRCARCGQKGHWARECTNPPDDYHKRKHGTSKGHLVEASSSSAAAPGTFFHFGNSLPLAGNFMTAAYTGENSCNFMQFSPNCKKYAMDEEVCCIG